MDIIKDDIFVLCTDGLYDELDDSAITDILQNNLSMSDICANMIEKANKNGGHDNITTISLKVTEEDFHE